MSLMLGPIHHWIFAQIRLADERGDFLAQRLPALAGEWQAACDRYPRRFADGELEDLVDDNIHQSLENMIIEVLGREARLSIALRDSGEELGALARAYGSHGRHWASRVASALGEEPDAAGLHAVLRDLWLEGMPCDIRLELVESGAERVRWLSPEPVLGRYWTASGGNLADLLALQAAWLHGFVGGFDGFRLTITGGDGEREFLIEKSGGEAQ